LAACYAVFIAKGHCFNDANKRTAAAILFLILKSNGISIKFSGLALGDWIIEVATDRKTEIEFAAWLRSHG
jgi:death-on-curing protein